MYVFELNKHCLIKIEFYIYHFLYPPDIFYYSTNNFFKFIIISTK